MKVLLTGGAGYIGSHTGALLLNKGYEIVIVDNLSNSSERCIDRICAVTGKNLTFYQEDCTDKVSLKKIFLSEKPDAVIHFAGYKAVGESVKEPLKYYENNVGSTMAVIEALRAAKVKVLVFSSSATVYKLTGKMPLYEDCETYPYNPYGWTKFMSERIIEDEAKANSDLSAVNLRYFNPVGAHPSGMMGENPRGIPNNLMPYITQVALKKRDKLHVFGADYPTSDGTGVRDYIHIQDLAEGHLAALEYAFSSNGCDAFNIGTGKGTSVLELVNAFQRSTGVEIPYDIVDRRPGDLALYYADASKAKRVLGWEAKRSIEDMCQDAWNWQRNNPNGY